MTLIDVRPLHPIHRSQVEEVVRATGVFSEDEVRVALEVFDAGSLKREAGGELPPVRALPASTRPPAAGTRPLPDYELIGAFDDNRLIGYACYGPTPATDRTYDLYWIAVRPDAQGSGTGSALMTAIERRLMSRPARMLVIETSSRNEYAPTRRFYTNRGYEEVARLRDFYARGDDRVVLSKRMSAALEPLPAET